MSTLFPSSISIKQVTGSRSGGKWVPVITEVTFTGSVQPVSAHELLALDIGRQNVGKLKIYSNSKIFVSRTATDKSGDLILWDGKLYEVIQENYYANGLIPHYKYFAELRPDNYQGATI